MATAADGHGYRQRLNPIAGEYRPTAPTAGNNTVFPAQLDVNGRLLTRDSSAGAALGVAVAAPLTEAVVAVDTTVDQIAAADSARNFLMFTNNGPEDLYYGNSAALAAGNAAGANRGALLKPGMSVLFTVNDPEGPSLTRAAWYGVTASGTTYVATKTGT